MDGISAVASVLQVVQICAVTIKLFADLKDACRTLPGRLEALEHEVIDLSAVLKDVEGVANDRKGLQNLGGEDRARFDQLLTHATGKLNALQRLLVELTEATKGSRIALVKANAWRKVQSRLRALQDEIQGVKTNLNILLGASTSRDMVSVRLELETISTTTSHESQKQDEFRSYLQKDLEQQRTGISSSITQLQEHVDERIRKLEQTIKEQEERLYQNKVHQLGIHMTQLAMHRRRTSQESNKSAKSEFSDIRRDSVGVRMTQHVGYCRPSCPCQCHRQRKTATPSAIDRWVGMLSVQFAGIPMTNVRCNHAACEKAQSPQVSVEYWFPIGVLWSQIIRLKMGYEPSIGPQLQLSMLRRVPDSAPGIEFAMNGNIDGLKDLFRRGLASPRDVSSTRGYTMLRWAMYAKKYETCRFLMNAGADPDYRPISPYDNSPRNKANDFILQGGLSKEAEEIYRQIAAGTDYIDEQNYTMLHKVVLGLSFKSLEEMLRLYPDEVEAACAMGRTPLSWAACRGDQRSIVLLLAHGADPNTVDAQMSGPVSNAADRGHTACVRLLLEAGGDPDPVRPGVQKGSPLNCSSRNATDPLLIKTLLDFGADIEAAGVDGITPLIHVSRRDNVSFAQILLEYGAEINSMSSAQQTPLTIAITHNSHKVLRLLLDRWYEYSECPRLKGPHMLPLVAAFADLETMQILTATDHLKLKYDPTYKVENYLNALRARYDCDEKLEAAFLELLDVLDFQILDHDTLEGKLESGVLSRRASFAFKDPLSEHDDEFDMDKFEDALEHLAQCPVAA